MSSPQQDSDGGGSTGARTSRWLLAALFTVGLALRLLPIMWGSTHYHSDQHGFHPDESKFVRYADDFPVSLETNHDYRYALAVHHGLGVLWFAVRSAVGIDVDHPSLPGEDSYEVALLFCRAVSALASWALWFLLVIRLTRAYGREGDVPWVVAFCSVQTSIVAHMAVVQSDIPAAICMGLFFVALLRVRERGAGAVRAALVLGAWLGLATAVRYTSAVLALPAALHFAVEGIRGRLRPRVAVGGTLLCALVSLALFFALVPGAIYDTTAFIESLRYEAISKVEQGSFDPARLWREFQLAVPVPHLILGAIGAAACARSAGGRRVVWYAGTLVIYTVLVHRRLRFDYLAPLLPLAAVLAGIGIGRSVAAIGGARGWRRRIVGAVAALALAAGHVAVGDAAVGRYTDDTHYRFQDWAMERVDTGSFALVPAPRGRHSTFCPRLPQGVTQATAFEDPEWLIVPERTLEPLVKAHKNPDEYVPVNFPFDVEAMTFARYGPRELRFFQALLAGDPDVGSVFAEYTDERLPYRLDTVIAPRGWPLDMQGLEIRIYRRVAGGD